ncbi:cytochrome P450 [Cupriavidus numazuensis]|uniref:Cytochrome P450 126 n=1 Tax=Cupriavidus numazuensis TaxID=221992 RepID=A0ABN7Q5W5_9BURK|nr:cytochrome P450 [Cupriavidus numazuensis]CAG2154144.1 Putative cytochrome P450 126 [Cupriavidus numazuensis]
MDTTTIDLPIPDLSNPETFVPGVPHEAFDRVRAMPGLYWQPATQGTLTGGFWAVTRHADIIEIERDPEAFTSTKGFFFPGAVENISEVPELRSNIMLNDPPTQTRLRKAAARSFAPRVVAQFDEWVREIVVEVIEDIVAKGEFDWVADVAAIIPSRVVARVIGVPFEERQKIVDWTNRIFHASTVPDNFKSVLEASEPVHAYMEELRPRKLRDPKEDMGTILAQCVERGEISEDECCIYLSLLCVAGFETTHTAIAQSMRMIVESPEIAETVNQTVAAGGVNALIEEFLRYITPAMNMARTATRDLELRGQQIRKGDMMLLYFTAANRDPAIFSEPHQFNPARVKNEHITFGSGAHHCIGNALARLEMRILFEELHKRNISFKSNGNPKRGWSTFINQLFELPLAVVR